MTFLPRLDAALGGLGRPLAALVALCAVTLPLGLWGLRMPLEAFTGLAGFVLLVTGVFAGLAAVMLAVGGWLSARTSQPGREVKLSPSRAFGGADRLPAPRSRARAWRNRLR